MKAWNEMKLFNMILKILKLIIIASKSQILSVTSVNLYFEA